MDWRRIAWSSVTGGLRLLSIMSVLSASAALAGDWPQILGPNRNGIAEGEQLAKSWPAKGPKKLWEARVGSGFAGVAVAENQVVLFHREGREDKLSLFQADTGDALWDVRFPSSFVPQIVDDDGPRVVPIIQDGAIYAYSAEGHLYCVDMKSKKLRWKRDTFKDFGANGGYFGAGSAPIVDGKRVIVNVGGDRKDSGIVAFDTETGKTVWTAVKDQASYSAPVLATLDGVRHLLCITRLNFVSLNPETGKEQFRIPFGQRGPTVNAAVPVVANDHILLTASYGIGARWLKFGKQTCDVLWDDTILSSQYTTPILHGGAIYGIDGRQDGGDVTIKCFDPQTKDRHWSHSNVVYSTLIGADDKLFMMQTDGTLKMLELTTEDYRELGSAKLLSGTCRALPALSNGRFYVRNEQTLLCVDLSAH